MNILTFDIEDWYIEKQFNTGDTWKYQEFDSILNRILDALDEHSLKATFFCIGILKDDFSYVVKTISKRGHEIGCHSHIHTWINKMTPKEFREDTRNAIDSLEQLTGNKIKSYRAPAFSIGENTKWAFEVLAELRIENDSSIFPGTRDFGGFPAFSGGAKPCRLNYNGCWINEFPISMTKWPIIGKEMAYSGGGYFRMLPINFVKSRIQHSDYTMCYFHIVDLLDFKSPLMSREEYERYFKETGTLKARVLRYIKANLGRKRAFKGLKELLDSFDFYSVEEAASALTLPTITL